MVRIFGVSPRWRLDLADGFLGHNSFSFHSLHREDLDADGRKYWSPISDSDPGTLRLAIAHASHEVERLRSQLLLIERRLRERDEETPAELMVPIESIIARAKTAASGMDKESAARWVEQCENYWGADAVRARREPLA